jgi:hypothetical protein
LTIYLDVNFTAKIKLAHLVWWPDSCCVLERASDSKTFLRARYALSMQPYVSKVPRVQRDLRYRDFGSGRWFKMESNNFLIMT